MTAEERERMNTLCLQIQQEKDYAKFEALSHELNDLVARKQRRFPERLSPLASPSERAWKVMPAVHSKLSAHATMMRPRYLKSPSPKPNHSSARFASAIRSSIHVGASCL